MDGYNWTTDDLQAVRQAKLALATGKRVMSSDTAGKTRSFQGMTLEALTALENEIVLALGNMPLRTYAKNGGDASI